MIPHPPKSYIDAQVAQALMEDLGDGDYTAMLIDNKTYARAKVIARQPCVLCGVAWVESCVAQVMLDDHPIKLSWHVQEGQYVDTNTVFLVLEGHARTLLTVERCILNFLQTLSGTATETRKYVDAVSHTTAKIYDTRKTIPGWRLAQKYAVRVGGGENQRMGLYDAILIKENHITAKKSIAQALSAAREFQRPIQIEVENLDQLREALDCGADLILLDNMHIEDMIKAVEITGNQAKLEASGGINLNNVGRIADTGVHRISIGSITKDIRSIDLSMRFF
jgi:nicotinate-nucleotide pyrophosphorylase (carboxylating)